MSIFKQGTVTLGAQNLAHIHHDLYQESEQTMLDAPVGNWYSLSRHDRMVLSKAMQLMLDQGFIEFGPNHKPILVKAHAVKHNWERK